MKAAVLRNTGDTELEIRDDVEVADPGPGEVKIDIKATGICHSDLSGMNGTLPQPAPAVLGHEGSGVISAVGDGVENVAEGDHVIVAWSPPCGQCVYCVDHKAPNLCADVQITMAVTPHFSIGGEPVYGFAGAGTFAESLVVPHQAAIKIPEDVPFEVGSLIGCGVMTGVGAAINTSAIVPGSSVVVFGCGGVGISCLQGARAAGAATIVAVDLVDEKLEMAKQFGATHAVKPDGLDELKEQLTANQGFDYSMEAIGSSVTMRAAYDAIRRGGTACIVGVGRAEDMLELSALELFYSEKTLVGSYYGSADVRSDFQRMINMWRAGLLDLEGMISKRMTIDDINEGLHAMERGEVIRQVITF